MSQVAETVGPEGRYLHLGLTSSDVVDTALALQLRAAGERLLADADRLDDGAHRPGARRGRHRDDGPDPLASTRSRRRSASSARAGRSRSPAAGERLAAATAEIATGKISGPVGTYSHLDPDLEAEVLGELGLRVDPVSTQIVQRDRHAAFLAAIAILGGTLERLATEVRNLQHTEIAEVMEPFKRGQKGSSAMPHKRNPILSERIAGLARLLRGYAQTAFENQPLWHERDISHSSAERVILPDATILLDYMLAKTTGLVEGLVVRPERMRENIERGLGLHASSRVLLALVEQAGLSREEAYAIVQRNALRAADERRAAPRAPRHRLRSSRRSCRWPRSTPASTTRRSCATSPPSSPGSTRSRRDPCAVGRRARDEGGRRCRSLTRSSARARSATCTASATTGCCSSRRTGCPRSTSCCRRRSRTRAAC